MKAAGIYHLATSYVPPTFKPMNKLVFVLTILTLPISGQAQALQGWFQTIEKKQGFHSDLFHFNGTRFYYRSSGCTGSTSGQGTFAVNAHSLQLYFEETPADTGRITRSLPCQATTPTFCFLVVDRASGTPLPGVSIISKKTGAGAATNSEGMAAFAYSPPTNEVLTVRNVGYTPIDIPLSSAASQGFTVKLGPPYYFSAGDTLIFQLKTMRRNSFALRPVFDSVDSDDEKVPYTHCSRIAAGKAKKKCRMAGSVSLMRNAASFPTSSPTAAARGSRSRCGAGRYWPGGYR
jgi:hypothetical protein